MIDNDTLYMPSKLPVHTDIQSTFFYCKTQWQHTIALIDILLLYVSHSYYYSINGFWNVPVINSFMWVLRLWVKWIVGLRLIAFDSLDMGSLMQDINLTYASLILGLLTSAVQNLFICSHVKTHAIKIILNFIEHILYYSILWPVFMLYTDMCSLNGDQSGQLRSISMTSQWPLIMTSQLVMTMLPSSFYANHTI